jgi:hypothetical protein
MVGGSAFDALEARGDIAMDAAVSSIFPARREPVSLSVTVFLRIDNTRLLIFSMVRLKWNPQ